MFSLTNVNLNNKCWLWHRWDLVFDTGKTKYFTCRSCPARKAKQTGNGFQPIDSSWVLGHSRLLDRSIGRHFPDPD